ncbi:MAG: hypothetical protein J0M04_16405 [Verrucomicrobia bacterium]|nr:hypothetical protein [Verrucomicrobiota bacterium]
MTRYAERYVPPRTRPLTDCEKTIRRIARDLKVPTPEAVLTAAPLMAALIDPGPCWLVPIPSSSGSTGANMALCRAIKAFVPAARIVIGIRRRHAVESSCAHRCRGLMGLAVEHHAFERCCGPLLRLPVWFVDNVVTTGTTLKAAHLAFGTGDGLVFADASSQTHAPNISATCGIPAPQKRRK